MKAPDLDWNGDREPESIRQEWGDIPESFPEEYIFKKQCFEGLLDIVP